MNCLPPPRVCQRTHWPNHKGLCRPNTENVGLPFLVSVPESRLSYARLTQLLEGYSRYAAVFVAQPHCWFLLQVSILYIYIRLS